MDVFEQARAGFDRYIARFRGPDGSLPFALEAKFHHTGEVCEIAEKIVAGEAVFSPRDALVFRLCALFHDISRFEQYDKFKTFLDRQSFDHGDRSAALIDELALAPELPPEDRACVVDAVRVHNKFAIPADFPASHLAAAKMVRDADKLAILRLIIRFFNGDHSDPTIRLDLPDTPGWTPAILETVRQGKCVVYTDMKCINDFKLGLFAWSSDLNYPSSAALALDEDLFGSIRALLPASDEVDALLDAARARLDELRRSKPLLIASHLKKFYPVARGFFGRPDYVRAVDDVSFTLAPGETLGLVGESGCGKSTLARLLLRLEAPTEGSILLDGVEMTKVRGEALRKMRGKFQMIFQDPYGSLNPRMCVFSILEEALKLHTKLNAEGREARIRELLELVGLNPDYAMRHPHQFSGGQRQRIGIARALAVNPSFIIADEPVSALDVSVQAQIVNLLQDIQKQTGVAFLFIAHDLAVVEHICHRIMVMYLGKIMEIGPASELCAMPLHPYSFALLSSVPQIDRSRRMKRIILNGDVPSPLNPPEGCRFHTRCPFAQPCCAVEIPPLREISPGRFCACHTPGVFWNKPTA